MLPLFDLMMQAGNGKAMEAYARQFNLAQDQAAKAVAALMPAFSAGLKRQSSNPFDLASLMQKAAAGNYASYFEDLARAFTPQGMADGQAALEQIFGSQDVARAVAEQAAKFTGIGQDVMRQMMPALADSMMGGLFKEMTGQIGRAASNPFTAEGMAAMQRQWLESLGMAPRKPDPMQAQMQAMFDNPFTQAMQGFFAPKGEAGKAAETDPFSYNPFMKSFQDMMSGGMGAGQSAPAPQKPQDSAEPAQPTPGEAYQSFVNAVFDSGLEVQKNYQASLDAIFEQWKPKG
jgi:hypothetical protein